MIAQLHRKVAAYAFSAAFCILAGGTLQAQTPSAHHRVRAVITDLRTARQAHDVDLALRAMPGVRMSRTDFNTRNVLMEVAADCAISRDAMQALLQPFALTLACWSRDPQGTHDQGPLDPRTCAELQIVR